MHQRHRRQTTDRQTTDGIVTAISERNVVSFAKNLSITEALQQRQHAYTPTADGQGKRGRKRREGKGEGWERAGKVLITEREGNGKEKGIAKTACVLIHTSASQNS